MDLSWTNTALLHVTDHFCQAINNLPERVGVTATLTINYKAPVRADQFIVIKTQVGDVNGRKALVSGIVQDLEGKELANAS